MMLTVFEMLIIIKDRFSFQVRIVSRAQECNDEHFALLKEMEKGKQICFVKQPLTTAHARTHTHAHTQVPQYIEN